MIRFCDIPPARHARVPIEQEHTTIPAVERPAGDAGVVVLVAVIRQAAGLHVGVAEDRASCGPVRDRRSWSWGSTAPGDRGRSCSERK